MKTFQEHVWFPKSAEAQEDRKRYRVTICPSDAFGFWVDGGLYTNTLADARRIRTETSRGVGIHSSSVWIYDTKTGKVL